MKATTRWPGGLGSPVKNCRCLEGRIAGLPLYEHASYKSIRARLCRALGVLKLIDVDWANAQVNPNRSLETLGG
ncbi:MAG: hypothetical protein KAJ55_17175 [Anaerolineales bacterium]|nr:hypothetical protein [Anaerolineales bacterium]